MKSKCILTFLAMSLVAYGHAGPYDRWLNMIVNIDAIVLTILVSQIVCFLFIRRNRFKHYRMKILLVAKRLQREWWVSPIAVWFLSSFVLAPYMIIIGEWLLLLGALILLVFWIYYFAVVISKDKYKKWLSGIKALYFYLIASVGEIVGLMLYCIFCETEWFKYLARFEDEEFGMITYIYPDIYGIFYMLEDMAFSMAVLAIPYLLIYGWKILIKVLRKACGGGIIRWFEK